MKKGRLFLLIGMIVFVFLGHCAYQHIHTIIAFVLAPNWITIFSMTIFLGGTVYAIIERNFIIGLISISAAVVLPWVKTWIVFYWPYVRDYYFRKGGF